MEEHQERHVSKESESTIEAQEFFPRVPPYIGYFLIVLTKEVFNHFIFSFLSCAWQNFGTLLR